jgi:hypothetical protein
LFDWRETQRPLDMGSAPRVFKVAQINNPAAELSPLR